MVGTHPRRGEPRGFFVVQRAAPQPFPEKETFLIDTVSVSAYKGFNMNNGKQLAHSSNKISNKKQKQALASAQAEQALLAIGMKKTMLLDLGDGAFTDQSVKIRPNTDGTGIVMKCTSEKRLLEALTRANIQAKVFKGSKHWIAIPTGVQS